MTTLPTISELQFELWCRQHEIPCRRIREARVPGHQRPDYALRFQAGWCIVEVKQIDQTPDDEAMVTDLLAGKAQARWVDPGARLRQSIKDASNQLRKLSRRGFPTVICLYDTAVGFYLERFHVTQAMFGQQILRFEVSADPAHKPRYLGTRFGKKATLTRGSNTSISAVAVLRQPSGSPPVIDLYHNPHARVPIAAHLAVPLVRKQYSPGAEDPDRDQRTVLDLRDTTEWREWLDDPDGKCDREIEKCLREFRSGRTS